LNLSSRLFEFHDAEYHWLFNKRNRELPVNMKTKVVVYLAINRYELISRRLLLAFFLKTNAKRSIDQTLD